MRIIKLLIPLSFIFNGCQDNASPLNIEKELSKTTTNEAQPKPQITKKEKQEIYKKLTDRMGGVQIDKFNKVEFWNSYPANSSINSKTHFYLALPANDVAPIIRLVMSYSEDRWIFFNRIRILADENIVFDQIFSRDQIHRDNAASSVWEIAEIDVTDEIARIAAKIGSSKKAAVRFSGDRVFDYDMTDAEIENYAKLAEIYDDLQPALGKAKLNLPRNSKGNDTYWRWSSDFYDNMKSAQEDFKKLKAAGLNVNIGSYGKYSIYIEGAPKNGRDLALEDLKIAESVGLNNSRVFKAQAPETKK